MRNRLLALGLVVALLFAAAGCDLLGEEVKNKKNTLEPGRILFRATKDWTYEEGGTYQIYSMEPDGSDIQQLTHFADFSVGFAALSPDGRKIALEGPAVGKEGIIGGPQHYGPALYIMNADGSDRHLLFNFDPDIPNSASGEHPFVWSPDSKHLIFHRILIPEGAGLYAALMTNLAGTEVRNLTSGGKSPLSITDWSSDGKSLLGQKYIPGVEDSTGKAVSNGQLFKMDLQSNIVNVWGDSTTNYARPLWSPNGQRIVFKNSFDLTREQDNGTVLRTFREAIYIMNRDGSDKRKLTKSEHKYVTPVAWSPDGSKILAKVMAPYPDRELFVDPSFTYHILLIDVEKGTTREVTPFEDAHCQPIGWTK